MIEIKCKAENFKLVPIEQIVPNPKNNNRHSIEQINAIAKLIKAHGFREPLTISNRSGFLNCGHARLEAATNLGMKEVPVIYQDFASEAEEYQHMTADNEIARWAELDFQGVYDALKEIPDIDTSLLGIEDFESSFNDNLKIEDEQINGDIDFSTEIDEKNDYIVMLFKTKESFIKAKEKFNLVTVKQNLSKSGIESMETNGLGRIVDGDVWIEKL